jgi:alkanesulfonate monooxygenase SsuD/methylene tetrahydromethanopterin reductase-like flavin-dependent oxidoreductase (luciferase family)
MVIMGGTSEGAARRAARIADAFVPSSPECWPYYRDEMIKLGKPDPGPGSTRSTEVTMLARDPEAGWDAMVPFFFHETNAYGAWREAAEEDGPYSSVRDYDALKATGRYQVLTPEQMVAQLKADPAPVAQFHPLCGGLPIDLAWDTLKLFETEVLPAFR